LTGQGTGSGTSEQHVATYKYRDERGRLLYEVLRYEPKTFKIRRKRKSGGFLWGLGNSRRVPYMLPELLEAAQDPFGSLVYVVEGEKDCDTLAERGEVASTHRSGPGVFQAEWAEWYKGVGQALVIADRDEAGKKNALRAYKHLHAAGVPVKIVECTRGKDVTDHLAVGGSLRLGAGSGLSDVTVAYQASEAASTNGNGQGASEGISAASDDKAAACADWALAQLWQEPPARQVHNGRADVAYRFAQQLRDVDASVALSAMRIFWMACPQVNSDGEVESYPWEAAHDTLNSALTSVPADWTPGVFAHAMDDEGWDERLITFSDVEQKDVHWLWRRRLPMGKVCILEGDPDLGKSTVTADIAARVTRGDFMPDATPMGDSRKDVLLISVEDDPEDTILPRLIAARADVSRVHTLKLAVDDKGNAVPLSFPEDMPFLRHMVAKVNAGLVVVDPIMGYLSETIQSHNDASVRRAMTPFAQVANDMNVCILMVRHLNKSGDMKKAKYRGAGSIAFTGAARSVFVVERHPEEPNTIVMAKVKMNLTASNVPSLAYELTAKDDVSAPHVLWTGPVSINADDLLAMPDARKDKPAREAAVEFLKAVLGHGPVQANAVKAMAKDADIKDTTLRRAREELKVRVKVEHDSSTGAFRGATWRLPDGP
jgi:AAA domain/Toprim domain